MKTFLQQCEDIFPHFVIFRLELWMRRSRSSTSNHKHCQEGRGWLMKPNIQRYTPHTHDMANLKSSYTYTGEGTEQEKVRKKTKVDIMN